MGFGILFIGYAITFGSAFFSMYFFADIVGCLVMIVSLVMLMQYQRSFKYSAMAAGVLIMIYAAAAAMRMMGYGSAGDGVEAALMGEQIYVWVQYAVSVTALLFDLLLLMSIARLAREVDLPEIAGRCRVWLIVLGVYFALWIFFSTLQEQILAASVRVYNVLGSGLNLFHAVWLVMMVVILLSCLKWIAPAEVVEAEQRGESIGDNAITKLGEKLIEIENRAKTPREKKEAEKMKRELDRPVKTDKKN